MRKLALVVFVLAAGACKREIVMAQVNCVTKEGPVVDCTVTQTKGTSEMEVCWDFHVTCANSATLDAHGCAKVKDKGTTNLSIPTDKIKVNGSCDGNPQAVVNNMTINGDKAAKQ